MTKENPFIGAAAAGLAIGLAVCIAFGVLDVQCYGTGKTSWNVERQACE